MRHIATAIALAITAGMTPSALGAEFVVTTTAATGVGSLEAIVGKVNASCDTAPHVITFDLNQDDAGFNGSWWTIAFAELTTVTINCVDTVLDGTSQSALYGDTHTFVYGGAAVGADGLWVEPLSAPEVVLVNAGINLAGPGSEVRGLGMGFLRLTADNVRAVDNVIGIEAGTWKPLGPSQATNIAVAFSDTSGGAALEHNAIANGSAAQNLVQFGGATDALIARNFLRAGASSPWDAVWGFNGTATVDSNDIVMTAGEVAVECAASYCAVANNDIVAPTYGIRVSDEGSQSSAFIVNNALTGASGPGILCGATGGCFMSANVFGAHGGPAIDLVVKGSKVSDGLTVNENKPGVCGYNIEYANDGVDAPVILAVDTTAKTPVISGVGCPGGTVDIFVAVSGEGDCQEASCYGEGRRLVGSTSIDGEGNFSVPAPAVTLGMTLTATVTAEGNITSEFGPNFTLPACTTAAECDTGQPCVVVSCDLGRCVEAPAASGQPCEGGQCDGESPAPACVATCIDSAPGSELDTGCFIDQPYCVGGTCVACISDNDCKAGTCDLTTGQCVAGCTDDAPPGLPDSGCGGDLPYCVGGTCVSCETASDCPNASACQLVECAANACQYSSLPDGTSCKDGVCSQGICDTTNLPPEVNDDLFEAHPEDTPLNFDPTSNDSDPNGNALIVGQVVTPPANGGVSIEADGTVTYLPSPDWFGQDVFTLDICEDPASVPPEEEPGAGTLYCTEQSVIISVYPTNDPPIAVDDTATTVVEVAVVIDVLANDTDVDPGEGFLGTCLGCGTDQASFTIARDNAVAACNEGCGDVCTVPQGAADDCYFDLIFNGYSCYSFCQSPPFIEGFPVSPTSGTVEVDADNQVTYTPNPGFVGTDTFAYWGCDPAGECDEATVEVTVSLVAPVCEDVDTDGLGDGTDGNAGCINPTTDSAPDDPNICADVDSDGCDDCSGGFFNPEDDGPDADFDGICDTTDICEGSDATGDSDADGICDDLDLCIGDDALGDADEDGFCDEPITCNDVDNDGLGDGTGDNVGCVDPTTDSAPEDPNVCADTDDDGCDDCSGGIFAPAADGDDADTDGICDLTDACVDADGDGLGDGTNGNTSCVDPTTDSAPEDPNLCADTDGDGCDDCVNGIFAPGVGCEPSDSDSDGIADTDDNCPEVSNPEQLDLDGDLLGDSCDDDIDGDGATNGAEAEAGTDPTNPDSDDDGLDDGVELDGTTDPNNPDTDGDGLGDGAEVNDYGTDPANPDSDGGGMSDGEEVSYGLDPSTTADDWSTSTVRGGGLDTACASSDPGGIPAGALLMLATVLALFIRRRA